MHDFLETTCREAGDILLGHFRHSLQQREKPDEGFVTEADLASERHILDAIQRDWPGSRVLAEESGVSGSGSGLRWIVDPLDGTTNFAAGIPHFAISIGVEEQGRLRWGAIFDPVADELFTAEAGAGAQLNGQPIAVGSQTDLKKALLYSGDWYYRDARFRTSLQLANRIYGGCRALRLVGSVALGLAWTACGRLDGFWQERVNHWDAAAGLLLVREAGGCAGGFDGSDYLPGASLMATTPLLRAPFLALLAPASR